MNKRPGEVKVTTEVGYCNFCGRTRNLRREEHVLGTLVRTIVSCESCHRTLSSSMGVAAPEPELVAEPEAVPAEAQAPEPARAKPSPKPPARASAATKPAAKKPAAKKPAAAKTGAKKPAAAKPASGGKTKATTKRK
ncbi:MAG TPA: hypothetical protein VNA65_08525 [Candidatus Dormibacteraeota bacterium]|nr:hypothetical protein [Candidatus Dormibacteraeota bacterium]